MSLLADIGAYNNLASSRWFDTQRASAKEAGRAEEIVSERQKQPLKVAGVGKGTQKCDEQLTVRGRLADGTDITFTAPCVPDSEFPGLLGLQSFDRMNAVIFCVDNKSVSLPPGGAKHLLRNLRQGSKVIDCERAPSGHMMIPINNWQTRTNESEMVLMSELPDYNEQVGKSKTSAPDNDS